jgi:hypothetical protein
MSTESTERWFHFSVYEAGCAPFKDAGPTGKSRGGPMDDNDIYLYLQS